MLGLLISLGIGLIFWLERKYDKLKEQGFAGIRTYPNVTFLGYSLGSLTEKFTPWLLNLSLGAAEESNRGFSGVSSNVLLRS